MGTYFLCTSRFLPPFCSEHVAVRLPEAENRQPPKVKTELAIHTWLAAWDSYSLAAAMLGQMTYPAAMSHKLQVRRIIQHTVLAIACFCMAGLADCQPGEGRRSRGDSRRCVRQAGQVRNSALLKAAYH